LPKCRWPWPGGRSGQRQRQEDLKTALRTGTIVTTDDRNWELRYAHSARRLSLSRAVAIDMESATIAAQGYRFRVPYGTLLCVSDKPLHGKSSCPARPTGSTRKRLPPTSKSATACALLRAEGDRLHSRKLRAFNEPPFR
jgi:AMP nucleosidase